MPVSEVQVSKGRGKANPLTGDDKAKYVELVSKGVSKGDAAVMLGRHPSTFQKAAGEDAEFKQAVAEAWQRGADPLIEEAERRGREGWEEPVFQKGELVGYVRKYSDNLLMFSIKGRRPEYKENPRVDITSLTAVRFEDRSAQMAAVWRVLADAGVDTKAIAGDVEGRARQVGGGSVVGAVSAAQGVLAEPSDV